MKTESKAKEKEKEKPPSSDKPRRRDLNSRRRYRDFIGENGIWSYIRKGDAARKDEKPSKPIASYLWKFIGETRGYRGSLALVLLMSLFTLGLGALNPWFGKLMIDTVLPRKDYGLLIGCCALLAVFLMSEILLASLINYMNEILRGNLVLKIKRRLMRHLQTLPLSYLHNLKVGGVIARLQQDTDNVGQLIYFLIIIPFRAVVMFMIAIVSLTLLNWRVTAVCMVFCAGMGVVTFFIFNVMRPFQKLIRKDNAEISARLTEVFSGIQVVRGFRREHAVKKDYGDGVDLLWRKVLYGMVVNLVTHRFAWSIHYGMEIAIWLLGGYYVMRGSMSVGGLVVFIAFVRWLFIPIFELMNAFASAQQSLACAERAYDLLDEKSDIADRPEAVVVSDIKEGVEFKDVTFAYPDGTRALDHVDLWIPKGKVTALVGPSGAGKSTIINLVTRFYDATEGKILLDGVDIRELKLSSYRGLISLALQDVFLFDGTVRENIAFGRPSATLEDVKNAAHVAHCHDFIEKLEKGYESIIGERGVKLSGGQKQRIALARAVLTDPKLLILDEATSNLDSESEGQIQEALKDIFKNRATIAIAHRLSTIMDADKIVVIDKGKIVEQGRHAELLEQKGRYYEMYSKQMEKARLAINYWAGAEEPDKQENAST